jgi:hypothetical protein
MLVSLLHRMKEEYMSRGIWTLYDPYDPLYAHYMTQDLGILKQYGIQ